MVFDMFLFLLFLDRVLGQKCRLDVLDKSEYIGCFVDTPDRLLPNYTNLSSSADNNRCILLCRDYGYMFAGTQNHHECYCGNNPWRHIDVNVDPVYIQNYDCNRPCLADSLQICGGGWRLSVYSTGVKHDKHQSGVNEKTRYIIMGVDNKIIGNKTVISCRNVRPTNQCARLCSDNQVCTGFVYSTMTGICQLYSLKYHDLCDYTLTEEGSSTYMVD